MKQRLLLSLCLLVVSVGSLFAQGRTISGVVKDAQGGPVIGANVIAQGAERESPLGAVTGFDGDFKLTVAEGDTALFITFVGYEDLVVVLGSKSVFDVTMMDKVLGTVEIVEQGYFTTTTRRKIGATTEVGSRAFEAVPIASLDNMIQGRAAGVMVMTGSGQPGSSARVLIRGQGTINGSSNPLYVIDGIPKGSEDFAQLNPNDIESMSILKDAASTSMYGSRAANGVILITTKRGKEGKVQYGYRMQYGWDTRTQDRFDMMNAAEKLELEQRYNILGRANATPQEIADLTALETDWPGAVFRTGQNVMHELNASGGNEKARFYWSGSYFKQDGIVTNTDFERFTTRMNVDYKATEKSKLLFTLTAGFSRYNEIGDGILGANLNNPVLAAYMANPYEPVRDPETGDWNTPGSLGLNPVEQITINDSKRNRLRYTGSIQYETKFTDDLTFRSRLGLEAGSTTTNTYFAPETFLGGQYNGGYIRETNFQFMDYNNVNSLQYDKTFDEDHSVTLVAATEILGTYSETNNFDATAVGDSRIRVAGVAGEPIGVGGGKTHSRLIGGLIVGQYSFKDKYIVQASFRRDGSSRFGPDNKYANFWSVGATWNITDEKWFDDASLDFISGLKLRASHGTQGNQDGVGDFPWQSTFSLGGGYGGTPAYSVTRIENATFTWEKQIISNIGVDFGFFKKRIQGTVEVYNKATDALFFPRQVTRTSGFGQIQSNVGSIRNRGIELDLAASILRKRNVEWTVRLTYSYNDNQVTKVDQGRPIDGTITTIREGSPINSFFMVRYAGVNAANGDPLYLDAQGNITPFFTDASRVVIGESVPPVNGGIDNTVFVTLPGEMGRVDFSGFLVFVNGVDRLNNVRFFTENRNFATYNQTRAVLDAWRAPGDVTAIPRYEAGLTQFDSRLLEDASYLRLRNVVIGYTLPQSLTKKIKFNSVRVYAQGQNLFTWTEFTNFDPENRSGVDVFQYPVPRSYTFGLQVQF